MSKKARKISMCLIVMIAMTIAAIPISSSAQIGSADGLGQFVEQTLNPEFLQPVTSLTEAPIGYIGITTKEQLNQVRNDLTANYILLSDIIFDDTDFQSGGAFYNGGLGWNPIGKMLFSEFTGIFDGNGKTISGLTQNLVYSTIEDSWLYVGLFGYSSGEIKNLGMTNLNVSASIASSTTVTVGGISGGNDGVITNCYTAGLVSAPDLTSDAGGIVGENNGTVSFSKNKCTVSAYEYSGGIVGDNSGIVTSCVNTGDVLTTNSYGHSGGIAAYSWGIIAKCYNTGYVKAPNSAGGIAASNYDAVSDCFNTGKIESTGYSSEAAGIAGYNSGTIATSYSDGVLYNLGEYPSIGGIQGFGSGTVTNCVYNSSYGVNGKGTGVSGSQMKYQASYPGFDFTDIWTLDTNIYRPILTSIVPPMYSISYYLNGGVLPTNSPTKYMVGSNNVLPIPTRSGDTFGGWYTDGALTGSAVTTIPYSSESNISYYAKWNTGIYFIKFNINGGTSGTMTNLTMTFNVAKALTTNAFKKNGYTFLGWATTSTGAVVYKDKAVINNLTSTNGATINLYAKWGPPILAAASYNYNSLRITWATADNATTYRIYRATSATGTYSLVFTAPSTARSWVNTGLVTGKTYYYKVYPVVGTTAYGHPTYKSARVIPSTPTVTLTKYATTSIKVTWTGVAGATKYQVYRATSLAGTYSLVYTATSTLRSWVNTGRTRGITYYYKVRAYHLEGTTAIYGAFSAVKSMKL